MRMWPLFITYIRQMCIGKVWLNNEHLDGFIKSEFPKFAPNSSPYPSVLLERKQMKSKRARLSREEEWERETGDNCSHGDLEWGAGVRLSHGDLERGAGVRLTVTGI